MRAVQSRASRHAWKSASVRFDRRHRPGLFEGRARLIERDGGAAPMFTRMAARIEATNPAPRIFVMRDAGADRNRAGLYVAIVDVPAFLAGIRGSAAGESGHAPLKRSHGREIIP